MTSGMGWVICRLLERAGREARPGRRRGGSVQPSAGATSVAISSIERRMRACGGSTEWTWKTMSVTRSSMRVGAERRDARPRACRHGCRGRLIRSSSVSPGDAVALAAHVVDDAAQADLGEAQRLARSSATNRVREATIRGAIRRAAPRDRRRRSGAGSPRGSRGARRSGAAGCATACSPSPAWPGRAAAVGREGRLPDALDQLAAPPGRACRRRRAARRARPSRTVARWRSKIARAVGAVEAERREGRRRAAGADAELEPAAGEEVEHRGVLGDAHRVLERQGDDAGAEADARGPRRDVREEHEGRRQAALGLVEVVLRHPGASRSRGASAWTICSVARR